MMIKNHVIRKIKTWNDKEPADQEDQKHGEVVKESMKMREGYKT